MTARDDAIAAIAGVAYNVYELGDHVWTSELATMLDAIPDDVLVRLAIERGALKPWTLTKPDGRQAETVYIIEGEEP